MDLPGRSVSWKRREAEVAAARSNESLSSLSFRAETLNFLVNEYVNGGRI